MTRLPGRTALAAGCLGGRGPHPFRIAFEVRTRRFVAKVPPAEVGWSVYSEVMDDLAHRVSG